MIDFRFWKKEKPPETPHRVPDASGNDRILGSYELVSELGQGAMGKVYLGRDTRNERQVAIKTMALADNFGAEGLDEAKSRFLREAKLLIWMNHPDIVSLHDVGEEHGLLYIAMEYVDGVKLSEYTKHRKLRMQKVLEITARIADALGYAHEQSITHRDVKPDNILYGAASNSVKIIDFGISRLTDLASTRTGLVIGTPVYMSPEQIKGKRIDGRSDLYSLGVTMYELLSGELPFSAQSKREIAFQIANEPHTDIASILPDLPQCVKDIVNKALAKDVEQRYQSGQEMARAIRRCAAACSQTTN